MKANACNELQKGLEAVYELQWKMWDGENVKELSGGRSREEGEAEKRKKQKRG